MKQPDSRAESGLGECWYRIPDARAFRIKRASLTLMNAMGSMGRMVRLL